MELRICIGVTGWLKVKNTFANAPEFEFDSFFSDSDAT